MINHDPASSFMRSTCFTRNAMSAERIAAEARPVDPALLIDQDGRVQLDILEIVVGMEAPRVGMIRVRQQPRGQIAELL